MTIACLAGCASSNSDVSTTSTAASAHTKPDIRATGASSAVGALAAATKFFDLTAARSYSASYGLLTPAARRTLTESDWAQASAACRPAGLIAYRVSAPNLTGTTVAVTVVSVLHVRHSDDDNNADGISYVINSKPQTFQYTGGQWFYEPANLRAYRTHNTALLQARGSCN
jgi:hypothetical protein